MTYKGKIVASQNIAHYRSIATHIFRAQTGRLIKEIDKIEIE